jgi:hypothetical protein
MGFFFLFLFFWVEVFVLFPESQIVKLKDLGCHYSLQFPHTRFSVGKLGVGGFSCDLCSV